ncbi:MFS transporter [Rhizobium sp. NFR03]|uniref:MFS transporter n=1 Tax=Rhizobium sp. NFR03 TaxID=1566263 RepID=UPI0008D794FA|nr:MFS transporter [Rhizobium sp. NFR03]SER47338.1 MFS transporter, PPP family, 3-phenylpropionic acid transporter [Rhizobium sp. NFR03]
MDSPSSSRLAEPAPPSRFVARIALLFSAPLFINGFALPFFPVWLASLSFDAAQISVILAVPMFVRVFSAPVAGMIADALGERTRLLFWSAGLSLLTALGLFVSHAFWAVLVIYTLQGVVYSPYVPIVEAVALTGVRRWGFDYARMRLWGSIAFICATMIGGALIGRFGAVMVLPAMTVGFVAMVVVTFLAPRVGAPRRPSTLTTLADAPPKALRAPDIQMMLMGVGLVNGSHGMLFAFSALYWTSIGFSGTEVGLLWSGGVAAEIAMFVAAKVILVRVSLWAMIFSGAGLAILRWLVFPLDLGFWGYFALQCSHAFTYAIMHTGLQTMLVRRVAERQETAAQGMYFFYTGTFTALCTFVSGIFYGWFGVHGFLSMAVAAFIGFALLIAAWTLQPQSAGSSGISSEPS